VNAAEKIDFVAPSRSLKIVGVVGAFVALRSARTRAAYLRIWGEWCAFCGSEFVASSPELARESHALRFCAAQRGRGVRPATIKHKAVILCGIYGYLKDNGLVKANIFRPAYEALKHARTGDLRPSQPLPLDQVQKLLDTPSAASTIGIRDRALLALLFSCLRVGEVLALRLSDLRYTQRGSAYLILAAPKAGHAQQAALAPWAAERVAALVRQRQTEGAASGDLLFVSYGGRGLWKKYDGKPLLPRRVNRDLKKYARDCGITTAVSSHWGRCSGICRLLESGVDHAAVRLVSRHASIQMVELYDRRRREIDDSAALKLSYLK